MRRKKLLVILSSRTSALIFALVTLITLIFYTNTLLFPHYNSFRAYDFDDEIILAEEESYCPGDRMFYTFVGESEYKGNVDIRQNWCKTGNPPLCPASLVKTIPNIQPVDQTASTEKRTHRVVPYHHRMFGGETWMYNETVAIPYQSGEESMYQVYFRVAEDCEILQNRSDN